jgi:hypothetical protein
MYRIAAESLKRCVRITWEVLCEVQVRAAMFRVRKTVFAGDSSLLGCDIVLFGRHFLTFWSIVLPSPSGSNSPKKSFFSSKAKAVRTLRTADTAVLTSRRHIPQDLFFKGKAVPVRAMKAYVGLELQFHSFLAWAVMWVPWAGSRYPLCVGVLDVKEVVDLFLHWIEQRPLPFPSNYRIVHYPGPRSPLF